jgi:hypothetical protein
MTVLGASWRNKTHISSVRAWGYYPGSHDH